MLKQKKTFADDAAKAQHSKYSFSRDFHAVLAPNPGWRENILAPGRKDDPKILNGLRCMI